MRTHFTASSAPEVRKSSTITAKQSPRKTEGFIMRKSQIELSFMDYVSSPDGKFVWIARRYQPNRTVYKDARKLLQQGITLALLVRGEVLLLAPNRSAGEPLPIRMLREAGAPIELRFYSAFRERDNGVSMALWAFGLKPSVRSNVAKQLFAAMQAMPAGQRFATFFQREARP